MRLSLLLLVALFSISSAAWAQTTIDKTIKQIATANNWSNGTKYAQFSLDDNITVTSSGTDSNTGKYYTNGNEWRLYQAGDATMTISAATGCTITSVSVTYDIKNNGQLNDTNSNAVKSGDKVTVDASSVTFSVGNSSTNTNGQVKVTEISVTYTGTSTVKEFSFSAESATAKIGEDFTEPTLTNEYGTAVSYSSSDESVATVASDGAVTLVAAGETTITATLDADKTVTASYTLTVKKATPDYADELTVKSFSGISSKAYGDISYTSKTTGTSYSGNAMNRNSSIQLRSGTSNNSNVHSGLIAYNSSRTLVGIEVEWNSETKTDQTLDIYGKTTAYSSANDLYSSSSSTQGTKLGSIVYGTSTQLDLTDTEFIGKYNAVGVRSNNGALYLTKITFTWSDGTKGSFTISGSNSDGYYGTYYDETAFIMPEDVIGYAIPALALEDGVINEKNCKTYDEKETVPAKTALLLFSLTSGTYSFDYTTSSETAPTDNLLHGPSSDGSMESLGDGYKYYKLSYDSDGNNLGFYWGDEEGATFTLPDVHRAYLAVSESSAAKSFVLGGGGASSIKNINTNETNEATFTLSGIRVDSKNLPAGIYIRSGKKFVVK